MKTTNSSNDETPRFALKNGRNFGQGLAPGAVEGVLTGVCGQGGGVCGWGWTLPVVGSGTLPVVRTDTDPGWGWNTAHG